MPRRKIPNNAFSVTGRVASRINKRMIQTESNLEYDLCVLLEFNYDENIASFEEQPVEIYYKDAAGKEHKYTPDVQVSYHQGGARSYLAEVKYRKDLFKNWKEIKPRIKAGRAYAKAENMDFIIITEKEIRTPFLGNAKLLIQYKKLSLNLEHIVKMIAELKKTKETTPALLLNSLSPDKWKQAELIPVLWHLIANRKIKCDLNQKLTMSSFIWAI